MKNLLMVMLVLLAAQNIAFGQREGYNGIFGSGIQINFTTNPPTVSYPITTLGTHDQMSAWEGSAAISDKNGKLLFYTDGNLVWNKNHQVMPNGWDVNSYKCFSTTQILIVPIPGDPYLYYIFGAGEEGGPLKYSLVDMRLSNGLGDVVKKDQLLYENSTEKLQVVKHASGEALWLITHEYNSNRFRTYFIDVSGINPDYVESAVGEVHPYIWSGGNAIGYLRAAPGGRKLALAVSWAGIVELLDFDPASGRVSNPRTLIKNDTLYPYGVAFSPDESKLYVSFGINQLVQFDLNSGSSENILNSSTVLSSHISSALQLGPDNKIYVNRRAGQSFLGVINNPNAAGAQCDFVLDQVPVQFTKHGLPEFIRYAILKTEGILVKNECVGKEVKFELIDKENVQSVKWNFGDEASGSNNHWVSLSPGHTYSTSGRFTTSVEATYSNNQKRSFQQVITIFEAPTVSLGEDIVRCDGLVTLTPQVSGVPITYRWSNGSSSPLLTVSKSGKYWVEVSTPYCSATDTIEVSLNLTPYFYLSNYPVCVGNSVAEIYGLTDADVNFLWSDGVTKGSRTFQVPGTYQLTASNRCGSHTEKIEVIVSPSVYLGEDTSLCEGSSLLLKPTFEGDYTHYWWQDGSVEPTLKVSQPGTYWLELRSSYCTVRDSVVVYPAQLPLLNLPEEPLCKGEGFSVHLNEPNTTYVWSDGVVGGTRIITPGQYTLTATNLCGPSIQNISINEIPELQPQLPGKLTLCAGEQLILNATSPQAQYRWQDGTTTAHHTVIKPGSYWVEVYNRCETVRRSIEVEHQNPEDYKFYNFFSPNNDSYNQHFKVADELAGSPLVIYNRWGKAVYSSQAYQNNWSGEGLPSGTYFVVLTDKCSLRKITRFVTLIR